MLTTSTLTIPEMVIDELNELVSKSLHEKCGQGRKFESNSTDVVVSLEDADRTWNLFPAQFSYPDVCTWNVNDSFPGNIIASELEPKALSAFIINFVHNRVEQEISRPFLKTEQLYKWIGYLKTKLDNTVVAVSPSIINSKKTTKANYVTPVGAGYLLWLESEETSEEDE